MSAERHTCDVCGITATWSDEWRWFGSLKSLEDCGHVIKVCSRICRDTPLAADLIADYTAAHRYRCRWK